MSYTIKTITMKVQGKVIAEVEVNPIEVIDRLIKKEIGPDSYVFERNGEHFIGQEDLGGRYTREIPSNKQTFDYITALKFVKQHLEYKEEFRG